MSIWAFGLGSARASSAEDAPNPGAPQSSEPATPAMALRPDSRFPDEMDDIVVKDVEMFRAEAMDDDAWWMCCYFANGERVSFHVGLAAKPKRVVISVTETPPVWTDIDAERSFVSEHPGSDAAHDSSARVIPENTVLGSGSPDE